MLLWLSLFITTSIARILDFSVDNVLQVKPRTYGYYLVGESRRETVPPDLLWRQTNHHFNAPESFVSSTVYNDTLFLMFTRELFVVSIPELLSARPDTKLEELPSTRVVYPRTVWFITSIDISEAVHPPVLLFTTLMCGLYQLDLGDLLGPSPNVSQPVKVQTDVRRDCVSSPCQSAVLLGNGFYLCSRKDPTCMPPTRVPSSSITEHNVLPLSYPLHRVDLTPLAARNHTVSVDTAEWVWGYYGGGGVYKMKEQMVLVYTGESFSPVLSRAPLSELEGTPTFQTREMTEMHNSAMYSKAFGVSTGCAVQLANTTYVVHYTLHTLALLDIDYDPYLSDTHLHFRPPTAQRLNDVVWHNNNNDHQHNRIELEGNQSIMHSYTSAVTCRLLYKNKILIVHRDVPLEGMHAQIGAEFTEDDLPEERRHLIKNERAVIISAYVYSGLCYPHTVVMDCCSDNMLDATQIRMQPDKQLVATSDHPMVPGEYFSLSHLSHTVPIINTSHLQPPSTTHVVTVMSAEHMSSCSLTITVESITPVLLTPCATITNHSVAVPVGNCSEVRGSASDGLIITETGTQLLAPYWHPRSNTTTTTTVLCVDDQDTFSGHTYSEGTAKFVVPTIGRQVKQPEDVIKRGIVSDFLHSVDNTDAIHTINMSLLNPLHCYLVAGRTCSVSIHVVDKHNNSNTCLLNLQVSTPPEPDPLTHPHIVNTTKSTLWLPVGGSIGLLIVVAVVGLIMTVLCRRLYIVVNEQEPLWRVVAGLDEETVTFTQAHLDTLNIVFSNEVIGTGGQAVVVKGMDKSTGMLVAIKIGRTNSSAVAKEYSALCQIQHPNIVPAYAYIQQSNALVMKYMGAGSLQSMLDAVPGFGLPMTTIIKYTHDILQGLQCLHSHGLVHRDIKPGNILVEGNGCRIADLGCAKDAAITSSCGVVGTVRYLPPELFVEQTIPIEHKPKRDIWSLGLIVLGMITGQPPLAYMHSLFDLVAHFTSRVSQGHTAHIIPYQLVYLKEGINPPTTTVAASGSTLHTEHNGTNHGANASPRKDNNPVPPSDHPLPPPCDGSEQPESVKQEESSQLVNFLEQCLQYSVRNRPSATDLLAHPLFAEQRKLNLDESTAAFICTHHQPPEVVESASPSSLTMGCPRGDTFTQPHSKHTVYLL